MTTYLPLRQQVEKTWGFDSSYMYCLATGKKLGYFFAEEFESIAATLTGTLEEQADEMAIRMLASMRPGLKWNKMRTESLTQMRREHPVETMAYLLNRLFDLRGDVKQQSPTQLHLDKIHLFDRLLGADQTADAWSESMHMLLEIDAMWGCLAEIPPFTCKQLLTTDSLIDTLLALLKPWHAVRVKAFLDMERQAHYIAQNPGAKRAFFDSFMEKKPPTEAQAAASKRVEIKNFMDSVLDEFLKPEIAEKRLAAQRPTEAQLKVVANPAPKFTGLFGVKKAMGQ